jgi:hypothetical protein
MTLPDQRISSEVPDRSIQKPRSSCKRELIRRSLDQLLAQAVREDAAHIADKQLILFE